MSAQFHAIFWPLFYIVVGLVLGCWAARHERKYRRTAGGPGFKFTIVSLLWPVSVFMFLFIDYFPQKAKNGNPSWIRDVWMWMTTYPSEKKKVSRQ